MTSVEKKATCNPQSKIYHENSKQNISQPKQICTQNNLFIIHFCFYHFRVMSRVISCSGLNLDFVIVCSAITDMFMDIILFVLHLNFGAFQLFDKSLGVS